MRTKKALRNTIFSFASYFILILIGFVVQRIFKDALGKEYLGISSLYSNIMTGLNVVELGFGSAIIANMYRPVANHDIGSINALLQFYKKIYSYIAGIVLLIGLCILPFVDFIVGTCTVEVNLKLIFVLYLTDSIVSYFITYKRSLLYANQQTYITTCIHTIAIVITNLLQIFCLITTKNFYLYLVSSILFRIIENVCINVVVNHLYPYVNDRIKYQLGDTVKLDIKKKVKGLIFHKIASFVVLGTDNIIISMMPNLGIGWVGVYSNYSLITTKLTALIDNIFNSITASVGNLLIEDDKEKSYAMFKNIRLINTWIYVYITVTFYFISFPFVKMWMGKEYVLDLVTVFVIALNLYIGGLRASYGVFKNAAGIFYEDRYVPVLESITNIVASIPFAFIWGLKGVLIGTICSNLVLFIYSYPKYVYHAIFGKDIRVYVKDLLNSFWMFAITMGANCCIMQFITYQSLFEQLIINFLVCLIVTNGILTIMNYRTNEFQFVLRLFYTLVGKRIRKGR